MKHRNEVRDKWIRKVYHYGQGASIGRYWHISRQRVNQIVHQTHQNQQGRSLLGKAISNIGRLIRGH